MSKLCVKCKDSDICSVWWAFSHAIMVFCTMSGSLFLTTGSALAMKSVTFGIKTMERGISGQRVLQLKVLHQTIQVLISLIRLMPHIPILQSSPTLGMNAFIHSVLIPHGSLMQPIFWLFKIVSKWRWPLLLGWLTWAWVSSPKVSMLSISSKWWYFGLKLSLVSLF